MASSVEAPPSTAWWGDGAAPTEHWPGVTIPVDDCEGKYRFDAEKADRVCQWFPRFCSHSKGQAAGQKFDLLNYQAQLILRPLFGWVHTDGPQKDTRRFRKAYIEIPKKNGKTQLIAGLGLYMLLGDQEPGAEVYVAAADREQARILFNAAKAMVEASPQLKKRLVVMRNEIRRVDDPTAFFQVLSAEAGTKHGPNIHCLIMDELHAQPDRELFETLTRGVIARRQPLILLITTAGDDDESICYEEYDYAKRVIGGTIRDEQHLPVIFEAQAEEDWTDPEVWRKVNPGLGQTIPVEALDVFAREAINEPRKRNDFLRYHLNRWTNQAEAWIPVEWWDACDESMPPDEELKKLAVAGGLDLSQKWDLSCFAVTFRQRLEQAQSIEIVTDDGTGEPIKKTIELNYRLIIRPWFWIPEETMEEHERIDRVPYRLWKSQGLVTVTEGRSIDYTKIYQDITKEIVPRFPKLRQGAIGFDPTFAGDIAGSLRDMANLPAKEVPQNYTWLSEPCHVFEALVKSKRVVHGGNRLLRNHIENVAVKTDDAGRIKPVKPKKSTKRIDGVVATLIALRMLATLPDPRSRTVAFVL